MVDGIVGCVFGSGLVLLIGRYIVWWEFGDVIRGMMVEC